MKLIRFYNQHGRTSVWLGLFTSLLVTSSALRAAPGGGGGFGATGTAGGPAAGVAAGGGGHAGAAAGGGGRSAAAATSGARSSLGGGRPVGGSLGGAPSSLGRGTQSSLGNRAGFGTSRLGGNPTITGAQSFGTNAGYRTNTLPAQRIAQPNNLWTQRATAGVQQGVVPRTALSSYQGRSLAGNQGYGRTGTANYHSRSYNDTRSIADARNDGYNRGRHYGSRFNRFGARNYYYYPYYGYGYNYFPASSGYYGGYAGLDNGYTGLDNGYATDGSLEQAPGLGSDTPAYNNGLVQPRIQDNGTNPGDQAPDNQDQVASPSQAQPPVASQQPNSPAPASRGPDSLVEAVQSELTNRGYYKGKVDSMFSDDTKEAIRKFQSDNQLTVTGLLNNATLMMLGLN